MENIFFGAEAFPKLQEFLQSRAFSQVLVLADENTRRDCYPLIKKLLPEHQVLQITSGEAYKTLQTCETIWQFLTEKAFDRWSVVVNLGGGVIGDMGGICAALYKRGITFVNVPTTLLAMVDASVGGKTGIDFSGFKNQLGVFQQPSGVFIDPVFLETLSGRQLKSGYAEMMKHWLIADAAAFETQRWNGLLAADWHTLIPEAVKIKSRIVETDPLEMGAQNGVLQESGDGNGNQLIKWREEAPIGKLDLFVDINFRLNSTGAYSDIILPTATWYEKNDLNTTDMHPFIHPLSEAVSPGWESKSDWQIFRSLAKTFSAFAEKHLGKRKDIVAFPMQHDSPFELAQPLGQVTDWHKEGIEPVPGKTMALLKVVERDYGSTYNKYIALGPLMVKLGNSVKGLDWNTEAEYEELKLCNYTVKVPGVSYGMPSLEEDIYVCDSVMRMAPETCGQVAKKSWAALSKKTGIDHHHLYAAREEDKITFRDIQAQPRKIITAPTWSGVESEHVSYTSGYTNIHEHIPFRTLTGRAQFYQDHEWFQDFGETFCAYRPPQDMKSFGNIPAHIMKKPNVKLRFITPHSKWGIHSSYQDTLRMLTLFRGGPYVWLSEIDAKQANVKDNDWVELINSNGCTMCRAVVSQRVSRGMALMYHAQEKNVNVPGSPTTGKRGGILNTVTRIIIKPTNMVGGYAQLAYSFNYYGTVGCNRDTEILLHKVEDQDIDWLERPLTPEREAQLNPPGIGKR